MHNQGPVLLRWPNSAHDHSLLGRTDCQTMTGIVRGGSPPQQKLSQHWLLLLLHTDRATVTALHKGVCCAKIAYGEASVQIWRGHWGKPEPPLDQTCRLLSTPQLICRSADA